MPGVQMSVVGIGEAGLLIKQRTVSREVIFLLGNVAYLVIEPYPVEYVWII